MGAKGAVEILFRKELERAENKQERMRQLEREYNEQFAHPYRAAERGYVDDVIVPSHTRMRLVRALERLAPKRDANPPKKHGNIPL
jgi:propionyl-CoA carboxylase beta chain